MNQSYFNFKKFKELKNMKYVLIDGSIYVLSL